MSSINTELAKTLNRVQRPGDYYTAGALEIFAPRLEVDGVGPIALPLLPIQAKQLIAVAEQAPYGRGPETLVDTQVRRTWQIDAAQVQISRRWEETLKDIVARVKAGLGVTGSVVAEFYKILVYDEGSFFVSHRDTEKAPGMFATLVIVLPSIYTGGELIVRHKGQETQLDLYSPEPSVATFAAFYADCVHEVRPVTSGCRLTLVYNLLRQDRSRLPEPPNYDAEQAQLAKLLCQWSAAKLSPDDESPEKLIYPLEHAYTEAEISFDMLKGADIARADVLIAAAEQAECDLHLALVSIEESGYAEYNGDYYGSRRRRWSEDKDEDEDSEFEIGEVTERSATLSEWQQPDGQPTAFGDFPFEEGELCPPGALNDLEPDETHFQEATGNAGASFDRAYRRAALVIWPRHRRLAVLNQAGLSTTLPCLAEMAELWVKSSQGSESPLWRQAHELAGFMLATWSKERPYYWGTQARSDAARMLDLLSQLKDTTHIDTFLADISAAGAYHQDDNPALIKAVGLLPPSRATELIERIIAGNATKNLGACGDLLARIATVAQKAGRVADLIPAAKILVNALPGDPARAPQTEEPRWRSLPPSVESGFIVDLLAGLGRIDAALADRAVDYLLAWPATYPLDAILIPAALELTKKATIRELAAFQRLRAACLAHLRKRIAAPLEPPADWTRDSTVSCRCAHCAELSRFLADPKRRVWDFRSLQQNRDHVEHSIKRDHCDVDCVTDKHGRPYGLICTKNQASYERRVEQRKKDLKEQKQLE